MLASRILLVTDNAADAASLTSLLALPADGIFEIEVVTHLAAALDRLGRAGIDAILVDLSLPDSDGIETFDKIFSLAPHIPIMTVGDDADTALGRKTIQRGAQGYLRRSSLSSYLIPQSLHNMIQRKAIEESLLSESMRANVTLNSISDAVIGTDLHGKIDYLNVAAENMTGWSKDEARGRPIAEVMRIVNGTTRQPYRSPIELVLEKDEKMALAADTLLIRRDGMEIAIEDSAAPIHDASGNISGAVIVFHDVTAARAMAMKMAYLAQHDALTKLPNRVLLSDRITQAIALAKRHRNCISVLFIDIDNFKHINDSLGHDVGDRLLQSTSKRLSASIRSLDTVNRQGGDEFVILLPDGQGGPGAEAVARTVLAALARPHHVGGRNLHITASIGISIYPEDAQDAETLLQHSDTAMYKAKEQGRNGYAFFDVTMSDRAIQRQRIEVELHEALRRGQFMLHYQPRVNLTTGVITGAEALVRWNHPTAGLTFPDDFIPVAEGCGLIGEIGRWVLHAACSQVRRWDEAGLKLPSISVNISALELRQRSFLDSVRAVLQETELDPSRLVLEITESALIRDPIAAAEILKELEEIGVLISIDDFGTGYSSLIYLTQFPITEIKIDRSFISSIQDSKNDRVITKAVISLGNDLGQRVVAEGVENVTQLRFLQESHCKEGQGFLFGGPIVADRFGEMLSVGRCDLGGVPQAHALGI